MKNNRKDTTTENELLNRHENLKRFLYGRKTVKRSEIYGAYGTSNQHVMSALCECGILHKAKNNKGWNVYYVNREQLEIPSFELLRLTRKFQATAQKGTNKKAAEQPKEVEQVKEQQPVAAPKQPFDFKRAFDALADEIAKQKRCIEVNNLKNDVEALKIENVRLRRLVKDIAGLL
jgi:hypothetical protein